MNRIAPGAEFSGLKLLDGSGGSVSVSLGNGSVDLGLGGDFTAANSRIRDVDYAAEMRVDERPDPAAGGRRHAGPGQQAAGSDPPA